jgi:hypothetical protein
MKSKKDPSLFDWGNNSLNLPKRVTDDQMIFDMKNHPLGKEWNNKTITMASLTAKCFTYEKMISKKFNTTKFKIHSIERDKKVHKNIIQTYFPSIKNSNFYILSGSLQGHDNCQIIISSKPQSVYEFFSKPTFDLIDYINLDYMGTMSKEKEQDIIQLFRSNNLNKELFISFTILGTRGHNNSQLFNIANQMKSNIYLPKTTGTLQIAIAKTFGVVSYIEQVSKKLGYITQCIRIYPYVGYNKKHIEYKFLFYSKRA